MPISIDDAIAEAEKQIRELTDGYPDHVTRTLKQVEVHAKAVDWAAIRVIAHDIKGQAATVGWPVLGAMAHSLQDSLDSDAETLFAEAVRLHLASMRFCIARGIAEADREGARLLEDLRALTSALHRRQVG